MQECQSGSPKCAWQEPATALLAVLSGWNHARLIPERNALAECRAWLALFLAWSFSSTDMSADTQTVLTLHRCHYVEGCPLPDVPACALRTDHPTLFALRSVGIFENSFLQVPTEKIVPEHGFLSVKKASLKRILAARPDGVNCLLAKNVTRAGAARGAYQRSPLTRRSRGQAGGRHSHLRTGLKSFLLCSRRSSPM